jgi:hypothetical protein
MGCARCQPDFVAVSLRRCVETTAPSATIGGESRHQRRERARHPARCWPYGIVSRPGAREKLRAPPLDLRRSARRHGRRHERRSRCTAPSRLRRSQRPSDPAADPCRQSRAGADTCQPDTRSTPICPRPTASPLADWQTPAPPGLACVPPGSRRRARGRSQLAMGRIDSRARDSGSQIRGRHWALCGRCSAIPYMVCFPELSGLLTVLG